ncbi:MAG: hypothetical protein V8S31_12265 [Lachnospiraceae bacterium]
MQYNRHNEGKKFCKRAGKTGDLLFTALEEISVFKRKKYGNAKEICNIYVNPGQIEMVEAYYAGLTDEEKEGFIRKEK